VVNDPRLGTYRRKEMRRIIAAQGRPCGKCGNPIDYSGQWDLDEIVPRVMGGDPLDISNVQPTHRRCNRAAGARMTHAIRRAKRAPFRTVTSRDWYA